MEQLLRLENAKLRELVFQHVPDAAKLYVPRLDHRVLEARAASEPAPDNEELRVTAEALQNKAAAVSRGRDEPATSTTSLRTASHGTTPRSPTAAGDPHERP